MSYYCLVASQRISDEVLADCSSLITRLAESDMY